MMNIIRVAKIVFVALLSFCLCPSLTSATYTPERILEHLDDRQSSAWSKVTEFYDAFGNSEIHNHKHPFAILSLKGHTFQFWKKGAESDAENTKWKIAGCRKEIQGWEQHLKYVTFQDLPDESIEFKVEGYFHQRQHHLDPMVIFIVFNHEARFKVKFLRRAWTIEELIIVHGPLRTQAEHYYVDEDLFQHLPGASS